MKFSKIKTNVLTLRSVSQYWIFGHFNFPTPRSIILRGVTFFCEYLCKNEPFSDSILDCLSGTQMGLIHEKIQKILWHWYKVYCKMSTILYNNFFPREVLLGKRETYEYTQSF